MKKRIRHHLRSCLLLPLLLTGITSAQDQATTLLRACQEADVVVRATVTRASDPDAAWHRLEFRSEQILRGAIPTQFALLEPAGACCGRSLFGMSAGTTYLLFLQRQGPRWHLFGGSRGVLLADQEMLLHLQQLLNVPANELAPVLLAGLHSQQARIVADAAEALAQLPTLQLPSSALPKIGELLVDAVQRGNTLAAPLAELLARHGTAEAIDILLPAYLDAEREDQAALLQRSLQRGNCHRLFERLPMHLQSREQHELRGVSLLAVLDTDEAQAGVAKLLRQTRSPRVQLAAATALLAKEHSIASLRQQVPAPVLELALRRSRSNPLRRLSGTTPR